jgi:hypothetical protein
MIKKSYNDDLFVSLNWILKKTNLNLDINTPSIFLLNRWLSMANPQVAMIVNSTCNRWIYKTPLAKENKLLAKFYHRVLPSYNKRITYLKKVSENKSEEKENLNNLASTMEISQREISMYNDALDFLEKNCK